MTEPHTTKTTTTIHNTDVTEHLSISRLETTNPRDRIRWTITARSTAAALRQEVTFLDDDQASTLSDALRTMLDDTEHTR